MNYISTRGGMEPQQFSDILLGGLAPDGGLTIPESYPQFSLSELTDMASLSYADLAYSVISKLATDIDPTDLKTIIDATYTSKVYCNGRETEKATEITPLTKLDETLFLQELSNGPTLAFKDMAMQLLGNLFEYVLEKRNQSINIVGATSGDTGSAAEYAMRGKKGVNVFMLSPKGKMSDFQRAQMFSLQDNNIFNITIPSFFDGCQDLVKAVNNDARFKKEYQVGAVNSINWGRIVAQVVYYFKGYLSAAPTVGDAVDFTVPSGNFGNVCAGHIARMMGVPIRNLVVATNENDVLDEFFKTGAYLPRPDKKVFQTSSPSMDISKASNLERFVFDLVGRDANKLADFWKDVESGKGFTLDAATTAEMKERYGFLSQKSTHAERLASIKEVFETYKLEIDTHTADGYHAAKIHRDPKVPMVITETALACKFRESIVEALGTEPHRPEHLKGIEDLPQRSFDIENDIDVLKKFITDNLK
ncbi:MAG: threonine synthase [Fibrobacterales bacterium]